MILFPARLVFQFFVIALASMIGVGSDMIGARGQEVRMSSEKPKAVRLIFEYDGNQIRLIKQQAVEMMPPPSDAKADFARDAGFWLELRSAGMQVLHRQIMRDPIASHPEVFSNEPGKTVSRSNEPSTKGAFTVVIPDTADSDHLAFVRANPLARSAAEKRLFSSTPTGEIARFSLRRPQ
jgi:hypothetical protein